MQADGIVRARLGQQCEGGAAVGKEILGMHLDERQRRQAIEQRSLMGMAPADAGQPLERVGQRHGAGRGRGLLLHRHFGLGLFGRQALHVLAGALGNIFPFAGIVVGLVQAGARVRARQVGAVVLARLGDAVALVLALFLGGDIARPGRGPGRRRGRTRRRDGGSTWSTAPESGGVENDSRILPASLGRWRRAILTLRRIATVTADE